MFDMNDKQKAALIAAFVWHGIYCKDLRDDNDFWKEAEKYRNESLVKAGLPENFLSKEYFLTLKVD